MRALTFSDDRTGVLATALLANGMRAAGASPTIVAVPGDASQACGLARLAGALPVLVLGVNAAWATLAAWDVGRDGDLIAVLPLAMSAVAAAASGASLAVVAAAHPTASTEACARDLDAWRLGQGGVGVHDAVRRRTERRWLPCSVPVLSQGERIALLGGCLDARLREAAATVTASYLAASESPTADTLDPEGLQAILARDRGDRVRDRIVALSAWLDEPTETPSITRSRARRPIGRPPAYHRPRAAAAVRRASDVI